MIHYFTSADGDTATAETDAAAQRLRAKGFVDCTADEHRQAWAAENARRLVEIAIGDVQAMRTAARAGVNVVWPSVVWPTGWKG